MLGGAAAHRAGVIHRDLKPDNVFLCERADGGIAPQHDAKVLDFGISQITSSTLDEPITREGVVLGTPSYMSPEQLKDARSVDARSDVYSMGVIFYEALTGRLPGCDLGHGRSLHTSAPVEPGTPDALAADLDRGFEQVLLRALACDRHLRYPDMESFVAAVRPFATHATPTADAAEQSAERLRGEAVPHVSSAVAPHGRARHGRGRAVAALALALSGLWLLVFLLHRGTVRESQAAAPAAPLDSDVRTAARFDTSIRRTNEVAPPGAGAGVALPAVADEPAVGQAIDDRSAVRPAVRVRRRAHAPADQRARAPTAAVGRSGTISLDDM